MHVDDTAPILACEIVDYLDLSAQLVSQSELNQRHHALAFTTGLEIDPFTSAIVQVSHARALTAKQYIQIMDCMSGLHRLVLLLLLDTGVRVSQLASIPPQGYLKASEHRKWSPKMHLGRPNTEVRNLQGKGGLISPVAISEALILHLESLRLDKAETFYDRSIPCERHYALPSGQAISQAFSEASVKALGFSVGAHSTRHFFVQTRMQALVKLGLTVREALRVVSQEVGHFRESITYAYF